MSAVDHLASARVRASSGYAVYCYVLAIMCLFLGGGTHSGFLGDPILLLAAVPLLLMGLASAWPHPSLRFDLVACAAVAAPPALQLVPLPPLIWRALPGRDIRLDAFRLNGLEPGWFPLSLNPQATANAALSMIAPIAIFLAVIQMDAAQRRNLCNLIVVFAIASVFLGIGQIAGGPESPLRFFTETNPTEAVGFFANRNHFAALLYLAVLLAAPAAVEAGATLTNRLQRRRQGQGPILTIAVTLPIIFLLCTGQILTRSRAGVGLTILALAAVSLLAVFDERNKQRGGTAALIGGGIFAVLLFAVPLGLPRFVERFQAVGEGTSRLSIFNHLSVAIYDFLPTGSGISTFPDIYALYEKPSELSANAFVNQGHNDWAQVALEGGFLAVAAAAVFFAWLAYRGAPAWLPPSGAPDAVTRKSAACAVVLVLLHSFVDYPLRTAACMALFAVACGLLTPAGSRNRRSSADARADAPRRASRIGASSPTPLP